MDEGVRASLEPPPAVLIWLGGRRWSVRTWLGIEGPGPVGSVLVRPAVWQLYLFAPDRDDAGPGRERGRSRPGPGPANLKPASLQELTRATRQESGRGSDSKG